MNLSLIVLALVLNQSFALAPIEEVTISDTYQSLPLLGAGLRNKKVAFLKFKVYVASVFAKNESAWNDPKADIAIRLDFLRNIPNEKIIDSFSSSLRTNDVDLNTPEMKRLFELVKKNGDIKEKQALTIVGKRGKTEQLILTLSTGETETIEGKPGLVKNFFSIWFGKMDDSGLESLRDSILTQKGKQI